MPKLDLAGVIDIYQTLDAVKVALANPVHRFRAAAMRRRLADVCEPMLETQKDLQNIIPPEFNERRISLLQRVARKDPEGKPILASNQYVIDDEKKQQFDTEIADLKEEFQEKLDEYDASVKKINEELKLEVEYPELPYKFKLSWFREDVRQEWLETLFELIEDDSEEMAAAAADTSKKGKNKDKKKDEAKAEK